MKATEIEKKVFLDLILNDGEQYAGIILGKDGAPDHHLILLPGEAEDVNWEDAHEFSSKAGGELPTRREQSLLYSNLKEEFEESAYWSGEQRSGVSTYAWFQIFDSGYQGYGHEDSPLRARAVRRSVIQ